MKRSKKADDIKDSIKLKEYEKSLSNLKTEDFKGLSHKEAMKLLKKNGENSISSQKNVSAIKIFAGQFKDFLVLILLIAAGISIFMGETIEAISISTILFLNAFMGFLQEYRTEKILETLDNMVTPNSNVIREGKICSILASKIVIDDLIFVRAGDTIPADSVILKSNSLQVDESILTGESIAVDKEKDENLDDKNDLNKKNILYMGTAVVKGEAIARVVQTGMKTQMGKIADMIEKIQTKSTPLQDKLNKMGKFIIAACLMVCLLVILVGILRGEDSLSMVMTGLSLAVASVPEGLPAIVTIALAFSVKHMMKRKALIKKLRAVETLGCANVICTDKTGTITQNKMTVKKIVTENFDFDVTGYGMQKDGQILMKEEEASFSKFKFLKDLLLTATICNDSVIFTDKKEKNKWSFYGEATEAALLIAANKAGVKKSNTNFFVFDELPFDSFKKYMVVFAKNKDDEKFVFVKGAYDVISKKCKLYKEEEIVPFQKVKDVFDVKHDQLSKNGMRTIALAYKKFNHSEKPEENLIFLGLCAMIDPPRKEAKISVDICKKAGIKTIMITGDNLFTAKAIAKKVGIYKNTDLCLEGKDLDEMNEDELINSVKKTTVFARVSPKHKLKIVKILKKQGKIVAMTGDGVNDAPAIKEANIGVSMGVSGNDVTKQAADLILLDDNFSSFVAAVEEGRIIYKNIRKFMRYLLSCNLGEVLTSFFAIIIGMPVPLLPMQILLINLVTDSFPAMALALEPKEEKTMNSPPRSVRETLFSKGLLFTIVLRGFLIAITTIMVFTFTLKNTLSIDLARTATFLTLVSLQLIHVFECKSETKSIFKINYLNNKRLILAVFVSFSIAISSIWVSPFNKFIKNYPLSLKQTVMILIFTLIVPIINAIILTIKDLIKFKDEFEEYVF